MYILELKTEFSAAHRLVNYPGVCSNIHGHNWLITIKVIAENLDESGMAIDLVELKEMLVKVVAPYDHRTLNEIEPFDKLNPTSENISKYIFQNLKRRLPKELELAELTVQETDSFAVTYSENKIANTRNTLTMRQ